jgi:signal transduction histidine kinase
MNYSKHSLFLLILFNATLTATVLILSLSLSHIFITNTMYRDVLFGFLISVNRAITYIVIIALSLCISWTRINLGFDYETLTITRRMKWSSIGLFLVFAAMTVISIAHMTATYPFKCLRLRFPFHPSKYTTKAKLTS